MPRKIQNPHPRLKMVRRSTRVQFKWDMSPELFAGRVVHFMGDRIDRAIIQVFDKYMPIVKRYMQTHRRWIDRTGDARRELSTATKIQLHQMYEFYMFHGVVHGRWLEVRWSYQGRYEIIRPALERYAPIIFKEIQALLPR